MHAREIAIKLINGSLEGLHILENCSGATLDKQLFPIVLAKRMPSSEFKMITSRRIQVKGKKYDIITGKCGASFSELVSRFQ